MIHLRNVFNKALGGLMATFLLTAGDARADNRHYDFTGQMGSEWVEISPVKGKQWSIIGNRLRVYCATTRLSDGYNPTFIGLPCGESDFVFTTEIRPVEGNSGDDIDIAVYRGKDAYVAFSIHCAGASTALKIGSSYNGKQKFINSMTMPEDKPVRLRITAKGQLYIFEAAVGNGPFNELTKLPREITASREGSDGQLLVGFTGYQGSAKFHTGLTYAEINWVDLETE